MTYNAPYSRISYSSTWDNDRVGYRYGRGRLNSPYPWHVFAGRLTNQYMQIDLYTPNPNPHSLNPEP